MIFAQSGSLLRRGLFGLSRLYERECRFSEVTPSWVPSLRPRVRRYDLPGLSLVSRMLSSQTVEKMRSNELVEEKPWDLYRSGSYEIAMEALSTLISRRRGDKSFIGSGKYSKLERMAMYLKVLDIEDKIAGLKIIHVAGTKGKGSTCVFSEAILRECGFRTGLFTSPHLIDVRERFRIDGLDISEEKFLKHFWDCWYQLKDNATQDLPMPRLFQFLTLLAFKIFTYEKVDVGIFEVGLGGKMDSTNVITEPVVCGIASLGMDHMESLGDTLGKIASHKAGILKPSTPAYTVPQIPEAMDVIKERAHELKVQLETVSPLSCDELNGIQLSLAGDHQYVNAALAVSLCKSWLQRTGNRQHLLFNDCHEGDLPDAFLRGLSSARLSGRAQIVYDKVPKAGKLSDDLIFYLDGAHSPESLDACARWFSKAVKGHDHSASLASPHSSFAYELTAAVCRNGLAHCEEMNNNKIVKQILLFNCMDVRNPQILLPKLAGICASSGICFSKAIFVPSMSTYNKVVSGSSISSDMAAKDLSWQYNLQEIWEKTINGIDFDFDQVNKTGSADDRNVKVLAPLEFLSDANSADCCPSSVVIPSLPLAIQWLRDSVQNNPSLQLHVLVTGSLHLVGDVLKLLKT